MLRITTQYRAASIQSYFVDALCKDDYYSKGTEQPGIWRGVGAEMLGLAGPVDREAFARLTENRHPFNDERLTPRTKDDRRVGYDITFSPPKSVSVVYAITKDPDILWAFKKSVWDTMREIEEAAETRVRIRGANHDRVTGNLVWSEYIHFTARPVDGEPDPQLHAHNFVKNCTHDDEERRWKAVQMGNIKRRAPYFEALALSHLAANLVSVGFQVERTEHGFEIGDVKDPGGIEAWIRLGEATGLSRDDVTSLRFVAPATRFAVDAYIDFARRRPWQEAVASSLTELFAPHIHQQRLDTWPDKYPWIETEGLQYFRNRLTQARRDVAHGLRFTLEYFGQNRALQQRALDILQFKLDVLWSLADAIMLQSCEIEIGGPKP